MDESGPDTKRQRLKNITPNDLGDLSSEPAVTALKQQQAPSVTSLFQVQAGLPCDPSPGAMHGCRIAAWCDHSDSSSSSSYCSALASGRNIFWSQLLFRQQQLQPEQLGKEGALLPLRLHSPSVIQLSLPEHAGEVQSLALSGCSSSSHPQSDILLATIDAFGAGSISRLRPGTEYTHRAPHTTANPCTSDDAQDDDAAAAEAFAVAGPPEVAVQARFQPLDCCREAGWAGVAFNSSSTTAADPSLMAAARCGAKDVCLYDIVTGKPIRTHACVQNPYALSFLPPGVLGSSDTSIMAVAEGHCVSLWDTRAAGAGAGCLQRLNPGALGWPLYTLAWCSAQGGLLGSAGAERCVYLTEPRKWRVSHKWHGATRLAIHSLSFLDQDPNYAVLAGLDLEVMCGRWDSAGSNSRPFESQPPPTAATAATAASNTRAAPGAPGSGDRSRPGVAGAGGMEVGDDAGEVGPAAGGVGGGVLSFRGDGRWLGVSKAAGADMLAGFTASGNLVYARMDRS